MLNIIEMWFILVVEGTVNTCKLWKYNILKIHVKPSTLKLFTKHAPGSFSLRAIAISHATKTTRLHSLKPEAKSTSFDGGCYMILIHVLLQ